MADNVVSNENLRTRFWEAVQGRVFAFVGLDDNPDSEAPMTLVPDQPNEQSIWIFTRKQNGIAQGGPASGRFMTADQKFFALIFGELIPEADEQLIDRLWSPQIAAWYKEGRADPDLCVMRFDLSDLEIWLADMSIWEKLKLIVGADISKKVEGQHGILAVE